MESNVYWEQFRRSFAIVKKNVRIYYSKGPVIIFGLLVPFFLFLSFYIGRNISAEALIPGLLGITAFFTATSVGPAIVPWEARAKTLERLISSPISIWTIFLGDVFSSFLFGVLVSVFPVIVGLFIGVEITNPLILGFGIILATFCFACFSILLSAYPPTGNSSQRNDVVINDQISTSFHKWNFHSNRGIASLGKNYLFDLPSNIFYRLGKIFYTRQQLLSN